MSGLPLAAGMQTKAGFGRYGPEVDRLSRIVRIAHAYRNAYRYSYSVGYAQLHARLVCGCAAPDAWRPRSWRLFPGQWEVLCHGRTQCGHRRQRFHAPVRV